MIIARVASGVKKHMPARVSEWAMGGILLLWGLNVTFTPDYLTRPTWLLLGDIFSQQGWGSLATAAAMARLTALVINGTFADTWWSRFSPHVRAVMAFVACFFWGTQTMAIWSSHQVALNLSAPAVYILVDFYNIIRSSSDAGAADEAYRGRPS